MTKKSVEDPYAFNGNTLTKEERLANTSVFSNKKDTVTKVRKQLYIEGYVCL